MSDEREAHDAWFRAKVLKALQDTHPGIPHEEVEADFAKRREATLRRLKAAEKDPRGSKKKRSLDGQ